MLKRITLLTLTTLFVANHAAGAGFPVFDDPILKSGREIWLGTCSACHANSLSDAPQAKDALAWSPRIAKGREVLISHAINGFSGESGEMPPRGGNPNLNDSDINAALTYMLKLVSISTGETL